MGEMIEYIKHIFGIEKIKKEADSLMINKIINIRGKINKLMAWKKHLANLEKKL